MKREYIGLDAQFSFKNSWGTTSLRGEGLLGTQPGIAGSSKSPNTGTRPANEPENSLFKRPFIGYFFYLVHDIGTTPFSAVLKYDVYDPNTKLKGNEIGVENSLTSKTDLARAHSASALCTVSTSISACKPITSSTSMKRAIS